MAYAFASASSQNLTVSNALVSGYPVTLACWSFDTDATQNRRNIGIIDSGASNRTAIINHNAGNVQANSLPFGGGPSNKGTYSSNTYFHATCAYPSSASRTAYLDGAAGTTGTDVTTATGVDRFAIGGYITAFLDGRCAEVAVWNVALTDDEIVSLAKGFKPTRVRPQSLVFYAPLVRDLQDLRGALTITNNNTATVADHPRVY